MKTTRLFRNIWRVNAVIIFGAGVLALLVGGIAAYYMLKEVTRERTVDAVVNTETGGHIDQSIALGTPTEIAGHPWLLVPLESDQRYDQAYFSKDASAARNYAFVSRSLETRWLYPHSRFLIVDATRLPREDYDGESNPTALVSFEVVRQDTNGDRRLTPEDACSLVFTRPDGTGVTAVLENVSAVVSQELMGEDILVIYQDRDGYAAATFSLKDFSPVKRERLTLPPVGS
jgi:hypothetical protein